MIQTKEFYLRIACLVIATFFLTAVVSAQGPPDKTTEKITGFVKASKLPYTAHGNGTLIIDTTKGKLVVVAKGGYFLASFAQVLPKAYLPRTDTVLFNLLQLNDTLNYSKVGIDQNGDLFVRIEARADFMDKHEFDRIINNLIVDYDKVKNTVFTPNPTGK